MTDILPKIYGWGSKKEETLQYRPLWDFLLQEGRSGDYRSVGVLRFNELMKLFA